MYNEKIADPSLRTGVFTGDLKYGRKNRDGNVVKQQDFSGSDHEPVVPLTLVEPRDASVWRRDPAVKKARKNSVSQTLSDTVLHLMDVYRQDGRRLRANIHLTVGKTRL